MNTELLIENYQKDEKYFKNSSKVLVKMYLFFIFVKHEKRRTINFPTSK